MATRRSRTEGNINSFDYGAQYIAEPRTPMFAEATALWEEAGVLKRWKGRFATVTAAGTGTGSVNPPLSMELDMDFNGAGGKGKGKGLLVPSPTMNALPKHLLNKDIKVVYEKRVMAEKLEDGKWSLKEGLGPNGSDSEPQSDLGEFDWLVVTDRLTGMPHRSDLAHPSLTGRLGNFPEIAQSIPSVASLTLMIGFKTPLGLAVDGMRFKGHPVMSWAARGSSLPDRTTTTTGTTDGAGGGGGSGSGSCSDDVSEGWVVQSTPEAAARVIEEATAGAGMSKAAETRALVAARTKDLLTSAFREAVLGLGVEWPDVLPEHHSGHRWSAAFPDTDSASSPVERLSGTVGGNECFAVPESAFVACGDYFPRCHPGSIEGAYLSGRAAADVISAASASSSTAP
jgi:predicted NAD/FAD-dependent oxidoreductase